MARLPYAGGRNGMGTTAVENDFLKQLEEAHSASDEMIAATLVGEPSPIAELPAMIVENTRREMREGSTEPPQETVREELAMSAMNQGLGSRPRSFVPPTSRMSSGGRIPRYSAGGMSPLEELIVSSSGTVDDPDEQGFFESAADYAMNNPVVDYVAENPWSTVFDTGMLYLMAQPHVGGKIVGGLGAAGRSALAKGMEWARKYRDSLGRRGIAPRPAPATPASVPRPAPATAGGSVPSPMTPVAGRGSPMAQGAGRPAPPVPRPASATGSPSGTVPLGPPTRTQAGYPTPQEIARSGNRRLAAQGAGLGYLLSRFWGDSDSPEGSPPPPGNGEGAPDGASQDANQDFIRRLTGGPASDRGAPGAPGSDWRSVHRDYLARTLDIPQSFEGGKERDRGAMFLSMASALATPEAAGGGIGPAMAAAVQQANERRDQRAEENLNRAAIASRLAAQDTDRAIMLARLSGSIPELGRLRIAEDQARTGKVFTLALRHAGSNELEFAELLEGAASGIPDSVVRLKEIQAALQEVIPWVDAQLDESGMWIQGRP